MYVYITCKPKLACRKYCLQGVTTLQIVACKKKMSARRGFKYLRSPFGHSAALVVTCDIFVLPIHRITNALVLVFKVFRLRVGRIHMLCVHFWWRFLSDFGIHS